jgi:hypothetical protein
MSSGCYFILYKKGWAIRALNWYCGHPKVNEHLHGIMGISPQAVSAIAEVIRSLNWLYVMVVQALVVVWQQL